MAGIVSGTFARYAETSNNDGNLTRFLFTDDLHQQVKDKLLFARQGWMGPDRGGEDPQDEKEVYFPILQRTDLGKKRGDHVILPLMKNLTGAATVGNSKLLETSGEEAFAFAYLKVYVETMRHATGYVGDMSEVRNPFLSEESASSQLAKWLADQEEKATLDAYYDGFSAHVVTGISAASATDNPNWFYGGDATTEENVDSNDTLGTADFEKMSVWAEVNKINAIRVPDGVGGMEEGYAMIIHPFQMYDLRQDSVWQQAQREGNERGWKNPIFSGAKGMYAGIFIYTHTLCEVAASGVTDRNNKRRAIFTGAHAIGYATAVPEQVNRRAEDDYGVVRAWAISKTYGYARADWLNDSDSGTTSFNQSSAIVTTYAAQPY